MKIRHLIYAVLTVVVAAVGQSCVRDLTDDYGPVYKEGRDVTLRLRVGVPTMSVATRADMTAGTDSELNSLWVGIFLQSSGRCTYARYFPKGDPMLTASHAGEVNWYEIDDIETKSGNSYIVAVGNPEENRGWRFDPANPDTAVTGHDLSDLLPHSTEAAADFTWKDYNNIAIRENYVGDVGTPVDNLVMAGVFYSTANDYGNASTRAQSDTLDEHTDWENRGNTPVFIPASTNGSSEVELLGYIHLRRLISQVKFRIEAADYTGDHTLKKEKIRIVEVIPQSYRVVNVPYTSWLHERKSDTADTRIEDSANSGDVLRIDNSSYFDYTSSSTLPMKTNYRTSSMYSGTTYITPYYPEGSEDDLEATGDPQGYEFDFWMLENKRWAVDEALDENGRLDYDKREQERKNTRDNGTQYNSGIYTALCGETGPETMNNCAAFVEIHCRISYTEAGLGALHDDDDDTYHEVQHRTADAVYTVHLGGIGQDWTNFTHRRNHKYTYTVKVMDVDRIIVEAKREGDETRPGIEGVVTDVVNPPYDLDAHYAVVNIWLSNQERTGVTIDRPNGYGNGLFPFRIQVFDANDTAIYIDQENFLDADIPEMYWDWIEFRATTGPDVIAQYKPYGEPGEVPGADGKTFRLRDMAKVKEYPGYQLLKDIEDENGNVYKEETEEHYRDHGTDEDDTTQRWYTVFIKEYVYEPTSDESSQRNLDGTVRDADRKITLTHNNWTTYVNKSPRMCWLNTLINTSRDGESSYINSKFCIRQKSIQTFYDVPANENNVDIDAIGVEHINESFGYNLRWEDVPLEYPAVSSSSDKTNRSHIIHNNNGRHNTLIYLASNYTGKNRNDSANNNLDVPSTLWSAYVDDEQFHTFSGYNAAATQRYKEDIPAEGDKFNVPAIRLYDMSQAKWSDSKSDINSDWYIRIIEACMNRNRDNNGNGIIDPEEVRWYVPASSEIVDIVLGRNSFTTPLLDYYQNPKIDSPAEGEFVTEQRHQANTRFHFATSNQRVLWAEEGTTINPESDELLILEDETKGWNIPPQQVRCVRALGTDLSTDENGDLSPAFTVNDKTHPTKIFPTYFEIKNQRPYTAGFLEPHQETSYLNSLAYNGFEFSEELYEFKTVTEKKWVRTDIIHHDETFEKIIIREGGYYLPDMGSRQDYEFEGSQWLDALKEGGEAYDAGNYLPDPNSYSSTNVDGTYQEFPDWFYTGGDYYGANNYPPLTYTYSSSEFGAPEEYAGSRIKFSSGNINGVDYSEGWYVPDVNNINGPGSQNFWGGFFINRIYCMPGFYKADPNWNLQDHNLWYDYQTRYFAYFDASSGDGETIRERGYYLPDLSSGPQSSPFEGSAWFDEIYEKGNVIPAWDEEVDIYEEEIITGYWKDPKNPYGGDHPWYHLFIYPYKGGEAEDNYVFELDDEKFINNHGVTLNAANERCREEKGNGWRIPNMKEASLIKIAMENAGVYKREHWEEPDQYGPIPYFEKDHKENEWHGYDVGNFLSGTFRQFGIVEGWKTETNGYYTGIYYPEVEDELQGDRAITDNGAYLLGRIACITSCWNRHYYIRCVRDLREGEK